MLVRNWMNPTVISIEAQASMAEALNLLKENQIKTLPVFDRETLVGVVTDRDLKRASASDATLLEIHELLHALTRIKVRDIMSRKPITIPDTYTVEEAAEVLRDNHISGAPVMDAKGRMAIPTRYRERLGARCDGQIIVTVDKDHCLLVYPLPDWEELVRKLVRLPVFGLALYSFLASATAISRTVRTKERAARGDSSARDALSLAQKLAEERKL